MQDYYDINSIAQKLRDKDLQKNDSSKDSFWVSGLLVILLSVIVSALIPFVNAQLSKRDAKQTIKIQSKASSQTSIEHIEAYIWTTRLKVEELKLHHRLDITTDDKKSIVIKGNISKEEAQNWDDFLTWYDTKPKFPALLHQVEATAISGNIPKLKSVWFNETPTAYFADGSFGNIGTIIQDGWKIKGIEGWAVFVELDDAVITLSFQ